MKFTLAWLRDHLDTQAPLARLADTLTAIGLEVEGIEDPAARLAPFVTARVLEAKQHPNADRLRVCRVDTGGAEVTVVCGAPNARTGMAAVFAPPGAHIPGTGITLKVGEIRGVASAGMLVSARELALGDDHEGIIELPEGTAPGQPYAQAAGLDDPTIEVGVTPNRGDALGVRGIARDLAAAGLGFLKPWKAAAAQPGETPCPISWQIDWPEACPFVTGIAVRGLRNGPSPAWLQARLRAVGLRPRNALVDITNYFTLDLARPLHVFDISRLTGTTLTLRPGQNETFATLAGRPVTATEQDLVIADGSGAISLAGIVGGETTSCTDATTDVFIECALFDPVAVALAGRRHQILTDSRARFERGIDPSILPAAATAAARLIQDLCGGEVTALTQAGAEPAWRRTSRLRFARLAALGGRGIGADAAAAVLDRLGFAPISQDAEAITVSIPPWRNDIAQPPTLDQAPTLAPDRAAALADAATIISAERDLIEEVLRIVGLDTIAPISMPRVAAVPPPAWPPAQARLAAARRLLAARGFAECVTFTFMASAEAARFGPAPPALRLLNPIAADLDQLRPTPLATLLPAAARNTARGHPALALFEIGPAFPESGQTLVAAGLRCGPATRDWRRPGAAPDAFDTKADLWNVLAALGAPLEALTIEPDAGPPYHPGRSGTVRQGPKLVLGRFGALHPALLETYDLAAAAAFELFVDAVAPPKRRRRAPPDLASLQPVRRDFAFVVPAATAAETVLRAVRSAERTLLETVRVFDLYPMPDGTRSLGIEIVLQPKAHTLTDADIETISARVVAAAAKVGATLR